LLERCLVYRNCNGEIMADASSTVTLSCCLIAPEDGLVGDGTFVDAGGNIFGDPLFCVAGMCQQGHHSGNPLDYRLDETSFCLPQNNSCGQLIGALHVGCPTTEVADDEGRAGNTKILRLVGPAPNPTFDRLSFSLILDRPEQVDIRVVNVAGQAVRVLLQGPLGAGEHPLAISTAMSQRPLGAGVYNLVITAGRERESRRFVVLREPARRSFPREAVPAPLFGDSAGMPLPSRSVEEAEPKRPNPKECTRAPTRLSSAVNL
jgi:hypothetical protein